MEQLKGQINRKLFCYGVIIVYWKIYHWPFLIFAMFGIIIFLIGNLLCFCFGATNRNIWIDFFYFTTMSVNFVIFLWNLLYQYQRSRRVSVKKNAKQFLIFFSIIVLIGIINNLIQSILNTRG